MDFLICAVNCLSEDLDVVPPYREIVDDILGGASIVEGQVQDVVKRFVGRIAERFGGNGGVGGLVDVL